jgi:hypothetical protein
MTTPVFTLIRDSEARLIPCVANIATLLMADDLPVEALIGDESKRIFKPSTRPAKAPRQSSD